MDGHEAVDALHRSTLHGERVAHPERLARFLPMDPANRPAPFKAYTGVEAEPLPRQLRASSLPAADVLSGRRAEPRALDRNLLGTLLFLAAGVSRVAHTVDGEPVWFRTAMSAGNLHPVEVYVVSDGVHHYDPLGHALVPLRPGGPLADGVTLVLTGIAIRTCWKYGERGWRHLWWDAGTMLANLLAAADAHGVPAQVLTGFPDDAVAALVGIDGVDEMPLALVRLGTGGEAAATKADLRLPAVDELAPIAATSTPVARGLLRFPLVTEAQSATALDAGAVPDWRRAAAAVARPAPAGVTPPADADPQDRIEEVILRRGSTRMFRRETAPTALLGWGLPAACRVVPFDAAAGGTLLDHLVNVHDVADMAAGRRRYEAAGDWSDHVSGSEPRAISTHLCLDQPLAGDAVYLVFHAASLGDVLDGLGGRGYRAAHLEAGIVSGRLSLTSFALGHGATGITFYDGRVSRHFQTGASPLLATAVGVPATVPAPYGTPGAPAELGGYGRIMTRLAATLRRRSR